MPRSTPVEHLGQHIDRGAPALMLAHADVFAFRRLDPFDLIFGHALLLREAGAGRRERAVRAKCGRHRRPGDELFEIGLPLGNPPGTHRQPPRRAEGFNRLFDRQPRFFQSRIQHLADLRRSGPAANWRESLRCRFPGVTLYPYLAPGSRLAVPGSCLLLANVRLADRQGRAGELCRM